MTIVLDGTTGISTPGEAVAGNLAYTGTLTGSTGVVNIGSGQVYKDASGNVGVNSATPTNTGIDTGSTRLFVVAPNSNFGPALTTVADSSGRNYRFTDATKTYVGALDVGSGGVYFGSNTAIPVIFNVVGSERARIDSSGNLLVGTTTSAAKLTVSASSGDLLSLGTSGTASGYIYNSASATTSNAAFFIKNSSGVGSISCSATATSYVTSSDYRLKNTIAPMTGALAKVALLKPCTYKWNVDGSDGQGFIAHELAEVEPACVTGVKDAVDAEGNPQYQGIDTSFLVATLTAAIQEQQAIITALTTRITALEAANV